MLKELPNLLPGLSIMVLTPFSSLVQAVKRQTLTYDEKKELFTAVIKKLDGRAPVIVGTGSNDTAQTLNMNKLAEEVGADGVLVVGPFL